MNKAGCQRSTSGVTPNTYLHQIHHYGMLQFAWESKHWYFQAGYVGIKILILLEKQKRNTHGRKRVEDSMKTCRWFGPTPSIWTAGVTRSSLAALYPSGADTSVGNIARSWLLGRHTTYQSKVPPLPMMGAGQPAAYVIDRTYLHRQVLHVV